MKNYICSIFLLACLFCVNVSFASSEQAASWLVTQQGGQGAIGSENDISNLDQSTQEAATALLLKNEFATQSTRALGYLRSFNIEEISTEQLSRLILLKQTANQDSSSELQELNLRRNARTGGYGDYRGFASSLLSTAFALDALANSNQPTDDQSIQFIFDQQQPNGSWFFPTLTEANTPLTAYLLDTLWQYRFDVNLSLEITRAQSFLLSQQVLFTQLWSDTETSLLALIALTQIESDRSNFVLPINALSSQQLSNGSIENDSYLTALYIQLLEILDRPAEDSIQISGRVIDSETGIPLSNVQVVISDNPQLQTLTNTDGEFVLPLNEAGFYDVRFNIDGYNQAFITTQLSIGSQLSIADILLTQNEIDVITGEPITTGSLRGVVRSAVSGEPLVGANVSIVSGTSPQQVITGVSGEYIISNVDAGNTVISVQLEGFNQVIQTVSIQAQQSLVFSPLLQTLEDQVEPEPTVSVFGVVTDSNDQSPLSGVNISIVHEGGISSAITDASGSYQIVDLPVGSIDISAVLSGYQTANSSLVVEQGVSINFSPALALIDEDAQEGVGTISGVILDSVNQATLPGVSIEIRYIDTNEVIAVNSAVDGSFEITELQPGNVFITFNLDGYLESNVAVEIQGSTTLNFGDIELQPVSQLVSVFGIITESDNGLPIAGAQIEVSQNGETISVDSDDSGVYRVEDLTAGFTEIIVSLDGFVSQTASIDAAPATNIDFSPSLVEEGQESEPELDSALLIASVVNSSTGAALANVSVIISYTDTGEILAFQTNEDGILEIDNLEPGNVTVEFQLSGFQTRIASLSLQNSLTVDLGQVELDSISSDSFSNVVGQVINVRNNLPIENAFVTISNAEGLLLAETMTDESGSFNVGMIPQTNVQVLVSQLDFVDSEFSIFVNTIGEFDIEQIRLRPVDAEQLLPDLTILDIDTSLVSSDPQTFSVDGDLLVDIINRGNTTATAGFTVLAFDDVDNDNELSDSDTVLGEYTVDQALLVDQSIQAQFDISGIQRFRDAPISILLDTTNVVTEISETNNLSQSEGECSSTAAVNVDLALCLDSSGSVNASEFQLQLEGTARALENPNIVPRNGSVRTTIFQFSGSPRLEVPPTIITEANIQTLAEQIRSISRSGGSTDIAECIEDATAQIVQANLVSPSLIQVIDVSTDGGSSLPAILNSVEEAQEAGIDSLNAIGVGNANLNTLNQSVFPQPAGGDRGFVIETETFEEYVEAISLKIERETSVIDLTVGQLLLTEQVEDQIQFSIVIGNAGNGNISESLIVRFYDGDPSTGGIEIGAIEYAEGIAAGAHLTLTSELIASAAINSGTVFAIAEFTSELVECSNSNNQVSLDVVAQTGSVSLSLDNNVYQSNEQVNITNTVSNTSLFEGVFGIETTIADAEGNLVISFVESNIPAILPNESAQVLFDWNTEDFFTGIYNVTSTLRDINGNELDQSSSSFQIVSSTGLAPIVSINAITDRFEFHTTDTVELSDFIRNDSTNASEPNASLQIVISDPAGNTFYSETSLVGDLTPSYDNNIIDSIVLDNAAIGEYTIVSTVLSESGAILASDTTLFEVTNNLNISLDGNVVVDLEVVTIGDTQLCTDTVTNTADQDVESLAIQQVVVNLDSDQVISVEESVIDITSSDSYVATRAIETSSLVVGDIYSCAIQATVNGQLVTLASDFFEIEEAAVDIDITGQPGLNGRVLILLDDRQLGANTEPELSEQRTFLENLLTEAGWFFTIVTTAEEFETEFATGSYINYVLLSENEKISEQTQELLVDAVSQGAGLIEAGGENQRQGRIDEALGVNFRGQSNSAQGLSLFDSDIANSDNVSLLTPENVLIAELDGATSVAQFTPSQARGNQDEPAAITINEFDDGRAVYFGFDLLSEATIINSNESVFAQLIVDALGYINNPSLLEQAGVSRVVEFTVTNVQQATPARLVVTLPEGVELVSAPQSSTIDGSQISWLLELDAQETVTRQILITQPTTDIVIEAVVQSGLAPNFIDQASTVVELFVQEAPVEPIDGLGIAGSFNAFICDDFTSRFSDSHGRLAAGGNISLDSYGIATNLPSQPDTPTLIAGGDLSYGQGTIFVGSGLVGGSADNVNETVIFGLEEGASIVDNAAIPIDFEAEFNGYRQLSSNLALATPTGTVDYKFGGIFIDGDCSSDTQVFNLDGALVLTSNHLNLSCVPDQATIIFNIDGQTAGFKNIGMSQLSNQRERILYNFHQAEVIQLTHIGIEGSMLAPNAHFDNPRGQVNGTIIAKSWDGPMRLYNFPFTGSFESVLNDVLIANPELNENGFGLNNSQ